MPEHALEPTRCSGEAGPAAFEPLAIGGMAMSEISCGLRFAVGGGAKPCAHMRVNGIGFPSRAWLESGRQ
jgi:hypothetical protein